MINCRASAAGMRKCLRCKRQVIVSLNVYREVGKEEEVN